MKSIYFRRPSRLVFKWHFGQLAVAVAGSAALCAR
jgi:hypothetical protein